MLSDQDLKEKSAEYRRTILRIIKQARAGHTGGDLSSIDILNVLYNHTLHVSPETFRDPNRDRTPRPRGSACHARSPSVRRPPLPSARHTGSTCASP